MIAGDDKQQWFDQRVLSCKTAENCLLRSSCHLRTGKWLVELLWGVNTYTINREPLIMFTTTIKPQTVTSKRKTTNVVTSFLSLWFVTVLTPSCRHGPCQSQGEYHQPSTVSLTINIAMITLTSNYIKSLSNATHYEPSVTIIKHQLTVMNQQLSNNHDLINMNQQLLTINNCYQAAD